MSTDLHYSHVAAEGELDSLRSVAEGVVDAASVRVVSRPAGGMVMVRHVDPLQHTPFYLGEARVTECEVEVAGNLGYGCVIGGSSERVLYAAILDAVLAPGSTVDAPLRDKVGRELDAVSRELTERWETDSRRAASSRVEFEVR